MYSLTFLCPPNYALGPCHHGNEQVAIEHKSVSVYDDLEEGEEKPVLGEGLNKPTTVTLYDIFPKAANPTDAEKRRYEARVKKNTEKIGEKIIFL